MPERDLQYLEHILESINDIQIFVKGYTKETFVNDKKTFNAVIRMFEVIGEATKRISLDFKKNNDNVEWKKMAGLRDVLIHDYESVDLDAVWNIVESNLPQLKDQIEKFLKK